MIEIQIVRDQRISQVIQYGLLMTSSSYGQALQTFCVTSVELWLRLIYESVLTGMGMEINGRMQIY